MKLSDLCFIKIGMIDADFWLIRRGSLQEIGKPTKVFSQEAIGIKVIMTDIIDPNYLFYWFQYIHSNKIFEKMANGSLRLVNISINDIKNLPIQIQGQTVTEQILNKPKIIDDEKTNSSKWNDIKKTIDALCLILKKKYGDSIGEGRNRIVFGNDRVVFKVPKNENGFLDNTLELYKYRRNPNDKYARCRIITIRDIDVLVMDRVVKIPYSEHPPWASFIDCGQVGRGKNGQIVAYDYA